MINYLSSFAYSFALPIIGMAVAAGIVELVERFMEQRDSYSRLSGRQQGCQRWILRGRS